jgi:hypothetical protein
VADPRHANIDRWKRRVYNFGDGDVLSVTTILKMMYSWNLENWKIRRALDYALSNIMREDKVVHLREPLNAKGERHYSPIVNQIIKQMNEPTRAAMRGTSVHEALEMYFDTGMFPEGVLDDEKPYIEQALRWADEVKPEVIWLEPETYHPDFGYAGSDDWLMRIAGEVVLGDYKTGGVFESAAMQLTAYKNSERLYPKVAEPCGITLGQTCECEWIPMPTVDRLAVLDLKPDKWDMVFVTPEAEGIAWESFRGCLAQQRLKQHKVIFVPAGVQAATNGKKVVIA